VQGVFPNTLYVGPLRLPTYAALLSLGVIGAVLLSVWQGSRRGLAPTRPFDAALLGASGGLLGARAAHVVANWAFYRDHLAEALRLSAGGLAWQGGLLFGLLLIVLYGLRFRLSMGALLDALALGLAWFTLCLWLGSAAANDVYGRETFPSDDLLWRLSADLPDMYGLRARRINVPLLGMVCSGLVFVVLWCLGERMRKPGALFCICLALTGLGGLALVPLQANAVPYLLHVRLDWLFSLVLTAVGVCGFLAVTLRAAR
jgi:phosphatidylglycerol:prolipoprotein diacylglycerol transferase